MPPLATSSQAEVGEPARELLQARLVVDGDQCAHSSVTTSGRIRCSTAWIRSTSVSRGSTADRLLPDHRARVEPFVDVVDGDAGRLDARGQRVVDRPRAGELRQERRVHVDDAVGEAIEKRRREEVHVTGEDDQVDPAQLEPLGQLAIAGLTVGIAVELEDAVRNSRCVGAFECGCVAAVGRHGGDRQAGVDQRLQVRSVAGDEHPDHRELADHERSVGRFGDDGAHADPQVEDAPELVLLDAALGEPREDGRSVPALPVDACLETAGQHAREVAENAAPGHVRERPHVGVCPQVTNLVEVETVWRKQQLGVEVAVTDERAHEREPVRVQPARRKPDHHVARLAARAVDHAIPFDEADAGPREVELCLLIDPGQLGGLAADEHATCGTADLGGSLDELCDLLRVDAVRGDVVEQEQRVGAGAEHVVDAVRSEVHAGPAQPAGAPREHQLRADAVHRRGEEPIGVQRIETGKTAEALRAGRLDRGAEAFDDRFGRRKRDAGPFVRLPAPAQESRSLVPRAVESYGERQSSFPELS